MTYSIKRRLSEHERGKIRRMKDKIRPFVEKPDNLHLIVKNDPDLVKEIQWGIQD